MGDYKYCDGMKRRDVLQIGALSALGLTLPDLLRIRAAQAAGQAINPTASPKTGSGEAEARAKGAPVPGEVSCILLWMNGGPSHLDTFDPKPEAPQEIRGEFKAIPTK